MYTKRFKTGLLTRFSESASVRWTKCHGKPCITAEFEQDKTFGQRCSCGEHQTQLGAVRLLCICMNSELFEIGVFDVGVDFDVQRWNQRRNKVQDVAIFPTPQVTWKMRLEKNRTASWAVSTHIYGAWPWRCLLYKNWRSDRQTQPYFEIYTSDFCSGHRCLRKKNILVDWFVLLNSFWIPPSTTKFMSFLSTSIL